MIINRRTIKRLKCFLLCLMLGVSITASAGAEESKTYETFEEGGCGVEIGIYPGSGISMDSEELVVDFSHITSLPENTISAYTRASYVLTNISSEEIYTSIAVPEVLRVSKVSVNRSEIETFDSGRTMEINGVAQGGFIYVNSEISELKKDSVYKTEREILSNVDYMLCFDEAFSKYAITSEADSVISDVDTNGTPLGETEEYYVIDPEGELCLCSVVYNLKFEPGESKLISVNSEIKGEMERPTKYTTWGTTYTFSFVGDPLNSFSDVDDVRISMLFPENNILPIVECDAARFLDDDVWTIHFKGEGGSFSLVLGEVLTESEINDIYTSFGPGRIIMNVIEVVTATAIIFAVYFIFVSIKKRRNSGIGR